MKYNGRTVATVVFWASVAFCVYLTAQYWGSWLAVAFIWIMAPVATMLFAFMAGAVFGVLGAQPIDEPEDTEAPPELVTTAVRAEVVSRSAVIGHFKGEPIYDSMVVRGTSGRELTLSFVKPITGEVTAEDLANGFIHGSLLYEIKT